MTFTLFISSFLLAFSGAMMPGPLLTATIGASVSRGPIAGPLFIAGHGLLELLLVALLMLGLAPLLTGSTAFILISILGAGIMFYLAWGMLRSLPELTLTQDSNQAPKGSLITAGALLSLANPYWSIWWATIGLGLLMRADKAGTAGVLSFLSGHLLGDLVWYSGVSIAVWQGRRLMNDRLYRALIALCAVILAAFGFYFLVTGLRPVLEVSG